MMIMSLIHMNILLFSNSSRIFWIFVTLKRAHKCCSIPLRGSAQIRAILSLMDSKNASIVVRASLVDDDLRMFDATRNPGSTDQCLRIGKIEVHTTSFVLKFNLEDQLTCMDYYP